MKAIIVAEDNRWFDSRENCNAIISKTKNVLIAGCSNTKIPNTVTEIGNSAFYICDSLTSIDIPESVTAIGYEAFMGCYALTSLKIPNSVMTIGSEAFKWCDALTSINIPEGITKIGRAGLENTLVKYVSLPSTLDTIEEYAFTEYNNFKKIREITTDKFKE